MNPTDVLREEHAAIERALDVQEHICCALEEGGDADLAVMEDLIDFLREFADETHHHKEEGLLFPALERAGLARDSGPLAVMLHEHELGRALVGRLAGEVEALKHGDDQAAGRFCRAAREYAELLRGHIDKENGVLFPLAERMLDTSVQAQLAAAFTAHDVGRVLPERQRALICEEHFPTRIR